MSQYSKQHLSNFSGSIHQRLSNTEAELKKKCYLKKSVYENNSLKFWPKSIQIRHFWSQTHKPFVFT